MAISFTKEEMDFARSVLREYYGIMLPVESADSMDAAWLETSVDTARLAEAFERLPECPGKEKLLKSICVLSAYTRANMPFVDEHSYADLLARFRRIDMLRLKVFFEELLDGDNSFYLRCKQGAIKIDNNENWLYDRLIRDVLENGIPDVADASQAKRELGEVKSRRGRKVADPRIPVLMWGTYRLLTDNMRFRSPMPNALCQFIIDMLQIQGVVPFDSIIDVYWVRAQLVYIQKQPQSSITNGAQ